MWIALLTLATVAAVQAATPIPKTWEFAFTSDDKPIHKYFAGPVTQLQSNNFRDYLAWGKAEYPHPQPSKDGEFTTEIMLLKIQCTQRTYRILRHIRYDKTGKIIIDINKQMPSKPMPWESLLGNQGSVDLGKLPLDETIMREAWDLATPCIAPID